ncbi:MAG: autotransporter assembly complex protein TamA [Nitrospiraceae bacterium]|nr:autotransporter assembly complex protein TamA [Nitrospiraceae bacterium]
MTRTIPCALLVIFLAGLFQTAWAGVRLEVQVEGVGGELKKNVLDYLSIERQKNAPEMNEEIMKSLFRKAPDEIRTALQPFGFYTPAIKSGLERQDGGWRAIFVIDPGMPVIITKVNIVITGAGASEGPFENFKASFPLKTGQVLNQPAYEKEKRLLQEAAINHGFLDAVFTRHQILIYPARRAAEIFLGFDTGPQFRFGPVTFVQTRKILSARFLRKYLKFKEGDPYNVPVLLAFQDSLIGSGYFSQVQVTPEQGKTAGPLVPVLVKLTPAKHYQISLGAGYGTDTGVRGRLDWTDRWLNRRGHFMKVNLALAEIKQYAVWRYIVPFPPASHLDYTLGFFAEDTTIEKSQTYLAGVSYTRPVSPRWFQTVYFNVEREHFTVADETATSRLILPGATWTYKKVPPSAYADEGIRLILDVKGTAKAMGSSVSMVQARFRPKYVRGIGGFGSLILRGDAGATEVDNFQRLPASLRFFAGGENSIRGYSYKTLGPTNAEGLVEGGKYLLTASIEYDQRVYKKWGAAFFYDGGNAFSSIPFTWKSGAGVGIRWFSIVGPVKLDFAWAISNPTPTFHIYVSIGPEI